MACPGKLGGISDGVTDTSEGFEKIKTREMNHHVGPPRALTRKTCGGRQDTALSLALVSLDRHQRRQIGKGEWRFAMPTPSAFARSQPASK